MEKVRLQVRMDEACLDCEDHFESYRVSRNLEVIFALHIFKEALKHQDSLSKKITSPETLTQCSTKIHEMAREMLLSIDRLSPPTWLSNEVCGADLPRAYKPESSWGQIKRDIVTAYILEQPDVSNVFRPSPETIVLSI